MRLSFLCLAGLLATSSVRADFPQFRGPNGNGVVEKADPPTTWSDTKNLLWKARLPGSGWSQPVIVGNTMFVTAAVGDKLAKPKDMEAGVKDPSSIPIPGFGPKAPDTLVKWQLFALDADTGTIRWQQTVVEGKPQFPIHPSNTYATETTCADAERVYVYFGATGTMAAYSHAGKELWKIETGAFPFSNGFGSGSSPTLFDGKLYLANFNEKKSFVAAFDAKTGQETWRQPRVKAGSAWASPFVWKNSRRTEIIACGDKLVTSHDPKTGEELWRFGSLDTGFAPSPTADGDLLMMGASSPFSSSPLFAIRAGAKGDISLKKNESSSEYVAWYRLKGGIGMSSPVAADGYLYYATDGTLICVDAKTGVQKYKERLPKSRMITACPVVINGKIMILDETGKTTWAKTGPQFELIDTAEIKDTFWASPAVTGNRVYLRGVEGVYCFKKS